MLEREKTHKQAGLTRNRTACDRLKDKQGLESERRQREWKFTAALCEPSSGHFLLTFSRGNCYSSKRDRKSSPDCGNFFSCGGDRRSLLLNGRYRLLHLKSIELTRELSSAPHHVSTFCCLDKSGLCNSWWVAIRLPVLNHRTRIKMVDCSFSWDFTVNACVSIVNCTNTLFLFAWWNAVTRRDFFFYIKKQLQNNTSLWPEALEPLPTIFCPPNNIILEMVFYLQRVSENIMIAVYYFLCFSFNW